MYPSVRQIDIRADSRANPRVRGAFTLIEPLDFVRGRLPVVRQRKRAAFTLIELLVVIAIIAILAAILVPALKASMEKARRAHCSSNLHQIGIGVYSYAGDHDGQVPYPNWDPARMNAWRTYEAFRVSPGSNKITEGPYNLGHLWASGVITDPHVFYCISSARDGDNWSYEKYATRGWPSTPANSGDDNVRTSYNYWPQSVSLRERARGSKDGLPFKATSLEDVDVRRAMGTDLLHNKAALPHKDKGMYGLNAVFGDGHVRFQSQHENPNAFSSKYWPGEKGDIASSAQNWRIVMTLWLP